MKRETFCKVLLLTLFSLETIISHAQKLPQIQKISLHAPADIKIDGKLVEWSNQLQAYNDLTNVYYTMANDNKNLYLAVQASDHRIINKIMFGGIALAINKSGEKKMKDVAIITYPYFEQKNNMVYVKFPDTKATTDSLAMVNNRNFAAKAKLIKVTGIKEIDAPISIYNLNGINAVSSFDTNMVYTYELAIDLKLLGLETQTEKSAYNIELRGLIPITSALDRNGTVLYKTFTPDPRRESSLNNPHGYKLDVPTDFWGEYTLTK